MRICIMKKEDITNDFSSDHYCDVFSCELDKIARKYNSDKGLIQGVGKQFKNWHDNTPVRYIAGHNYVELYEKYFAELRDKEITLLEFGMGNYPTNGYSMKMWLEYFPKAKVHIIDWSETNFYCDFDYDKDRVTFFKLNQSNVQELIDFVNQNTTKYDIIIDDASHVPKDQYNTYKLFFSCLLKEKGIYVVEDLFTSNSKNEGDNFYSYMAGEYLQLQNKCIDNDETIQNIADIQSIHMYRSIMFIFKDTYKISI